MTEPTPITLSISLTPQDRDNPEGNSYFTAECREESGINGYGETKREALGDLLEELGRALACNHQNMELDKVLEDES